MFFDELLKLCSFFTVPIACFNNMTTRCVPYMSF